MNCPYCSQEMEQGVIQSPQEISWKRKKSIIGSAIFHKGSIMLSEFSFNGGAVKAFCCRTCKKVIIDFKDNDCNMNN